MDWRGLGFVQRYFSSGNGNKNLARVDKEYKLYEASKRNKNPDYSDAPLLTGSESLATSRVDEEEEDEWNFASKEERTKKKSSVPDDGWGDEWSKLGSSSSSKHSSRNKGTSGGSKKSSRNKKQQRDPAGDELLIDFGEIKADKKKEEWDAWEEDAWSSLNK